MSIHRFAARRDANEPKIRTRFAHHGWHTEQVSGAGMPDLIAWPLDPVIHLSHGRARTLSALVDVKHGPSVATSVQKKKWAELAAKGIPVYIVRGDADVDALVAGTLEPWGPAVDPGTRVAMKGALRASLARQFKASYTPPRSTRLKHLSDCEQVYHKDDREPCTCGALETAKEAEVFAPPKCDCVGRHSVDCVQLAAEEP